MGRMGTSVAAAVAVATLLLAGCGDDENGGGEPAPSTLAEVGGDLERLEAYLQAQPGVAEASTEQVELDTDYYAWEGTVVLTPDAPPEAVADILDAAEQFESASTLDEPGELTLGREGTDHELWWEADAVDGLAEAFVLAEERLPDLPWVLDDYGQFRVAALADALAIADVAAQVAAEAGLADHGWLLTTTEFAEVVANSGTQVLQVPALDERAVSAWTDVAEAVDGLDSLGLDLLQLTPLEPPGSYSSDPAPEGSVRLTITVDAGAADRADLGEGALAEELRGLVERTVPALAGFPHGSEYSLNAYVGRGDDAREVGLVQLTSDADDASSYDDSLAGLARRLLDQGD